MKSHKSLCKNLDRLLDNSPEASYWAGFIAADGSIRQNGMEVKLQLGVKDTDHVLRLKNFVGYCGNATTHSCFTAHSKDVVPKFTKKYGLVSNKTYRGEEGLIWPKNKDLFLAMVIGFIDGDGSVHQLYHRPDCQINIQLHRSWLGELQKMSDRLAILIGSFPKTAYINNSGYAYVSLSEHRICVYLKQTARRLGLPVLDRKWGKINESFKGKVQLAREHRDQVRKMLLDGFNKSEVAETLGHSISSVVLMLKRHSGFFVGSDYIGKRKRRNL